MVVFPLVFNDFENSSRKVIGYTAFSLFVSQRCFCVCLQNQWFYNGFETFIYKTNGFGMLVSLGPLGLSLDDVFVYKINCFFYYFEMLSYKTNGCCMLVSLGLFLSTKPIVF